MKIENLTAKSIVSKDYFSVSPDDEIRKILPKFEDEASLAFPVIEDGDFEAIITWRKILRRSSPPKTKVKKLMHVPNSIQAEESVIDIAGKMLEIGERAMPVFSNDEFLGIITQKALINAVANEEGFENKQVKEFCSEVLSIEEEENIGKAKVMMRENQIARVPVIDKNGKLDGSVDVSGIIRTLHPEKAMQIGKTKGESLPGREAPITTIMNHSPLTVELNENLKDVARKMIKEDSLYVIVIEENKPTGIITPKDILELMAAKKEEEGAYVQITGAQSLDDFEKTKILDLAERAVHKANKIFNNIETLIVHIKKQNSQGSKTQYMIKARIFTSRGLFTAKEDWDWELMDAANNCLSKLEKRFKKKHEKDIDSNRKKKS